MKYINLALVAASALGAAVFVGSPETAQAQKIRETGVCHLANTTAKKVLYNGECKITQESKDYGALITIRMGKAEPFKFGCSSDGSCQRAGTKVRMRDRGNGEASFRWQEGKQAFRLDVEAD